MGKFIYLTGGSASEYSKYGANGYIGCSCGCNYCFNKKGITAKVLGGDKPVLKSCFKNKEHAIKIFEKELLKNKTALQEHGLFFSFTTDPMLPETVELTALAVQICDDNEIPIKILTKTVSEINKFHFDAIFCEWNLSNIHFGFTLTGHDELEPKASPNIKRIKYMKLLHEKGYKTFASIEPIIDFDSSLQMIIQTLGYCDLYMIGLEKGAKYNKIEMSEFFDNVNSFGKNIYWKNSIIDALYEYKKG